MQLLVVLRSRHLVCHIASLRQSMWLNIFQLLYIYVARRLNAVDAFGAAFFLHFNPNKLM